MTRGDVDKNALEKFLESFVKVVEKHARYIVVSGFVAIAHGRSRATEDIDMIIERISEDSFSDLHKDLLKNGFSCMQSDDAGELYDSYLKPNLSIRYTKGKGIIPNMELKLAKDELDLLQLETRKKIPSTGLDVFFSSIEMNIAFKEELLKSPKDMDDARHLRRFYKERIDEKEIERIKEKIRRLRLG